MDNLELGLPADSSFCASITSPRGYLVLERQGVAFPIRFGHRNDYAPLVVGQVPVKDPQAMLRCKAGTAQRLGIKVAIEAGLFRIDHEQVGLTGASTNSIIRSDP